MVTAFHWPEDHGLCTDCGEDVYEMLEYSYMVQGQLWKMFGSGSEMLCIGCLESRLGRELQPEDFKENIPLNKELFDKSERLASRMGKLLEKD